MAGIYYKNKDGREVRLPGFVGPRGPKGDKGDKGDGEALKAFASGEAVRMEDVSTVEHEMAVKVRSKNILPYPYLTTTTRTTNGITFTPNADRSITISGVATADAYYQLWNADLGTNGIVNGGTNGEYTTSPMVRYSSSNGNITAYVPKGTDLTTPVTIYPQIEQGITESAYTPYIEDVSAVKVKKHGLNLWDEQWEIGNITNNGENMVATDTIRSKNFIPVKAGIKLYCHIPQLMRVVYYDVDKVRYANTYPNPGGTVTPTKDGYIRFAVGASIGTGNPAITEYGNNICISLYNSDATGRYEPYIEPTEHAVNADGTVAGVTSLSPTTTLMTDVEGVIIDVEYNRDINKAFDELKNAIIALGGNV